MPKAIATELLVAKEQTNRELGVEALSALRQTGVVLANSPAFQMIAGVIATRMLQRVYVRGEPVLDEFWANAILGAITAKAASGVVGDVISLLNPFD